MNKQKDKIKIESGREYDYWLHRMPGVGDVTINKLLRSFGKAKDIYDACNRCDEEFEGVVGKTKTFDIYRWNDDCDINSEYNAMISKGIRMVLLNDEDYPKRLKEIENCPYALYVKGKMPADDVPSVAIIGARNCSEYGTFVADEFGKALATEGINIISGMARGVDGISQRGAIKAGGRTFAVLGSGVDVCYPEGNYKLYRDIQENGGIISTFPPGTEPLKHNFPLRNRIVAGLADMILVVEARVKSGTSITVDMALKMGKDVYAVPGRLTDRLSDGCNTLIRDGAGVALSPEDVIRELALIWKRKDPESGLLNENNIPKMATCSPEEDIGLLRYMDLVPRNVEEIHQKRLSVEKGVAIQQTLSELILLCVEGKAVQVGNGYFYKVCGA